MNGGMLMLIVVIYILVVVAFASAFMLLGLTLGSVL